MPEDQPPPTQPNPLPEENPTTQQQESQPPQNLPLQPQASPPKKPNKLIIAIVVFIAITILINIPIPSYVSGNKANCLLIDNCPKAGLNFGPSLVQRILKRSPSSQPINESSTTTTTPPPSQTPQTENNLTANWKTYINENFGVELKHPADFVVEEHNNRLIIHSPYHSCKEKGAENDASAINEYRNVAEIKINLSTHTGKSYENVWMKVFGFEFIDKNSHYGKETIDSKQAFTFIQGAEMSFARKAMLIELLPTKFLEVNIYTPIYTHECKGEIKEISFSSEYPALADQILSTLKFLGKGSEANLKEICDKYEGVWLEDYSECESVESDKGIDEELCIEKGGIFNECASNLGCRHSDSGKSCLPTAACIKLCNFKSKN